VTARPRVGGCLDCAAALHLAGNDLVDRWGQPVCGATGAPHRPDLPAARPWQDPTLHAGQRVAAALDAGLALGQRLATCPPGTPEQAAYAAGWEDGWAAAEHHSAQAWRQLARAVRLRGAGPSPSELAARRGDSEPTAGTATGCRPADAGSA